MDEFSTEEIARYIEHLDSDDGADLLNEIPLKRQEQVIALLANEEKAGYLLDLMRYDEDVAGGLMAKELVRANKNWNILQTAWENFTEKNALNQRSYPNC